MYLDLLNRHCLRRCTWLLLTLLLAACSNPAPQPLHFAPPPWQDGEEATYVGLTNDSPASSAIMSVSQGIEGGDGWTFRRETSSPGGQEIVVVEMSENGYRPLTSTMVNVLADVAEQVKASYSGGEVNLELTTRQNNVTYSRISVPTDARDERTMPLLVRTLPLAEGYTTDINAFLPYTGRLERIRVRVEGRETIEVPAGSYDAWRVLLESPERTTRVWVGVDAPHVLARIQEDDNTFDLEKLTPGGP